MTDSCDAQIRQNIETSKFLAVFFKRPAPIRERHLKLQACVGTAVMRARHFTALLT
jgi:hypothetical protein